MTVGITVCYLTAFLKKGNFYQPKIKSLSEKNSEKNRAA